MAERNEIDSVSGTATTGHEWDNIKELNTPLPRWWVWLFYATIVWAIGYWIVYPAWPTFTGFTRGLFGYSSRAQVEVELASLRDMRSANVSKLQNTALSDIKNDSSLFAFARSRGKSAFGDNCAPCHGSGAEGSKGFPNLNDDDWLWGGTLEQIEQTIKFGIRSGHEKTRDSMMVAFGKFGLLKPEEIVDVANYVRSISGLPVRKEVDLAKGKNIFAEQCARCHGENGKGNQELGAPNLTDTIWLYGSDEATIINTISNGRNGVMPAWIDRLDPATIKALAIYVHSLGGGQ